jgi:aspartate oxidase
MSPPVTVALIAATAAIVNMFFTVFVAGWSKRRADVAQRRIDEAEERHTHELESRTKEAENIRIDREELRKQMREDLTLMRSELDTERAMRRECMVKLAEMEQRIRELERVT